MITHIPKNSNANKVIRVKKIIIKHEYGPEANKLIRAYQKANNPGFEGYIKLMNQYAERIGKLRKIDTESVRRRLRDALKIAGFNIPKPKRSMTIYANLQRKKESEARAFRRAKSEIIHQNPNLSHSNIEDKAKELIAKKKRGRTPFGKQEKLREKVIVILENIALQIRTHQLGITNTKRLIKNVNALVESIRNPDLKENT